MNFTKKELSIITELVKEEMKDRDFDLHQTKREEKNEDLQLMAKIKYREIENLYLKLSGLPQD